LFRGVAPTRDSAARHRAGAIRVDPTHAVFPCGTCGLPDSGAAAQAIQAQAHFFTDSRAVPWHRHLATRHARANALPRVSLFRFLSHLIRSPRISCLQTNATSNTSPSRAILVGVDFGKHDFQESLSELALLTSTAGSTPVHTLTGKRSRPDPALFIGSGKAEELKQAADALDADIVVFNHALSPAQQRNLERFLDRHVIDRTGLILDIFAQRAQSHVGKVQVELAQVTYRASRLVRAWSHLERQKGGIGMRGGPGERQLELDRRMLDERAKRLRSDLKRLQRQHSTQRRARARNDTLSISLVGYTNAGKSTLFNALTKARAYAADQLFATLDTTSRRLYLEAWATWCCRIRWASSATCRRSWWRRFAPRWKKPCMPTCCCTWWTRRARSGANRSSR
jgi:hypothetical protein